MKFTPTPHSKWTNSSLIKINNSMWGTLLKGLLDDEELSREEKNKRINESLEWFKMIENNCINGLLVIKK